MIKHSRNEGNNIWSFWECLKKAFNTKYHEDTKDKKNKISKNKFNPKNVCCAKCALLFITIKMLTRTRYD
jgi:hypothetical protein